MLMLMSSMLTDLLSDGLILGVKQALSDGGHTVKQGQDVSGG
jgi:hypothetical protein